MAKQAKFSPLAATVGAAFMASAMAAPVAQASVSGSMADNPFTAKDLSSGYAEHLRVAEGNCGEGNCGAGDGEKGDEGKCGEGNCGGEDGEKGDEGKCGEGRCGA